MIISIKTCLEDLYDLKFDFLGIYKGIHQDENFFYIFSFLSLAIEDLKFFKEFY